MEITSRTYGIEIEFNYKSNGDGNGTWVRPEHNPFYNDEVQEIISALNEAGVSAVSESYNHSTRNYWKLVTDASAGHELVSPILSGEDGLEQIRKVCQVLSRLGYKVDKRCGFHVHHGAQDLTDHQITSVFAFAMKWETVIDRLVSPSRRNNSYCQSNNTFNRTFSGTAAALRTLKSRGAKKFGINASQRYLKVNYQAYLRHGTIEFRQHQGTLDADKMIWWVILTQNIITKAIASASFTVTETGICFKRFRDALGCTGAALQNNHYVVAASKMLLARWNEFNPGFGAYTSTLEA